MEKKSSITYKILKIIILIFLIKYIYINIINYSNNKNKIFLNQYDSFQSEFNRELNNILK